MSVKLNSFFACALLWCSAAHSMHTMRSLFSKLTTATQVGVVGSPFAFAAAHKTADYLNPNAQSDHLQDASPEACDYVATVLASQNVKNPAHVAVKVSNSNTAANFAAEQSLFHNTIIINKDMNATIQAGVQTHGAAEFQALPFPEVAQLSAQAQHLNNKTDLQQVAALTVSPIVAHGAVKCVTTPIRTAWDSLYTTVKSATYDPIRSVWNRAYPVKKAGWIASYADQPTTLFRSAMRLPGSGVKLAGATVLAAAAYRTINQNAANASVLTPEQLQSAATYYSNAQQPTLSDEHPALFAQAKKVITAVDSKGQLTAITNQMPVDAKQQAATLVRKAVSTKPDNLTMAGKYWERYQESKLK